MSASVSVDVESEAVEVRDRTADLGSVIIHMGRGSVHLDPDTARKVATEILAILDEQVTD